MLNTPDKPAPGSGFHQHSTLQLLIALLIISPCLATPTPSIWWCHSCNSDVARIRHSRSTSDHLLPAKRQFSIFFAELNKNIKKINHLYKAQQSKPATPYGKLKWLKLKRMRKNMEKNQAHILPEFSGALQYFAGTLEVLSKVKITSANNFNEKERDIIYHNMKVQMRNLLCELQDNMRINQEKLPSCIPLGKMKINLPKSLDLTGVHMIDLNFFKKMKTFFRRSQRLLKNKKKQRNSVNRKRTCKVCLTPAT